MLSGFSRSLGGPAAPIPHRCAAPEPQCSRIRACEPLFSSRAGLTSKGCTATPALRWARQRFWGRSALAIWRRPQPVAAGGRERAGVL